MRTRKAVDGAITAPEFQPTAASCETRRDLVIRSLRRIGREGRTSGETVYTGGRSASAWYVHPPSYHFDTGSEFLVLVTLLQRGEGGIR